MSTLPLPRFAALLSALRSDPDPHQRLAAEVQLQHAALDALPPDVAARLIAQARTGDPHATHRLQLTVCPPRPSRPASPPAAPAPAPVARPSPLWPLPARLSPPLALDPPDALRRSHSSWQQAGLIPADLPPATLAAAFSRLHGRRPMRRRSVAVYGLLELGRTVLTLKLARHAQNSQE